VSAPTSFNEFIGNESAVEHLRASIAADRLPHSMILGGPSGSGKYTVALMLAMSLNCELKPRENSASGQPLASFCGQCSHCLRIAESQQLDARIEEAVTAREDLRETDRKETRILIQTHPDVLVIPPDPPQLLIKLGQIRSLIGSIYRQPQATERLVYIITSSSFMKEAANSLLKVLEEPPAYAHIILLSDNPGELLPTIRSRCALVRLGAVPPSHLEPLLAERHADWKPAHRALVARLSDGAVGRALGFDLTVYTAARQDALILLRSAVGEGDHTSLFRMTETYRAGAEGQQKTNAMLSALAGLLEDILFLSSGTPELLRNIDIRPELQTLADATNFAWMENAVRGFDQVKSGMRRNLLRSLSLDAFADQLSLPRR
jgi:DNA polymerase III subunit delta'